MSADDLRAASTRALQGNLEKEGEKLARQGKLFVRDRLALLLDPGSLVEMGLLANAVAGGLGGSEPLDEALLGYQRRRDEMSRDVYHATQDIAAFDGDPDVAAEAFARFGVAAAQETMEIAAFG